MKDEAKVLNEEELDNVVGGMAMSDLANNMAIKKDTAADLMGVSETSNLVGIAQNSNLQGAAQDANLARRVGASNPSVRLVNANQTPAGIGTIVKKDNNETFHQ